MRKIYLVLVVSIFSAIGCSTAIVRVMPGEGGVNKVIAQDIEKDDAQAAANKGAFEYCEKQKKTPVFIGNESTQYTGSMDEGTRNTIRTASKVANTVGFQTRGDHEPGKLPKHSPVEVAGSAGEAATNGRDYKSELTFRCQ